jgi:uncharacterized protein (DUF1697 family)
MKYIAFLRGINVGGHQVKMAELKKVLEDFGLENVKTLIASGNVTFETSEQNEDTLSEKIENVLKKKWNFNIPVILRTFDEIAAIVRSEPFKKTNITKNTRLYVTFLKSPRRELFTAIELSEKSKTVDLMSTLEKEHGKQLTTRNWNTIMKLVY